MRQTIFLVLFVQLLSFALFAQEQKTAQVNFESDSYELSETAKQQLDKLVLTSKDAVNVHYNLQGHTDADGDVLYNQELSKNRCTSVRNYLNQNGIATGFITMNYYGENTPVADNFSDTGKSKNRRVEVQLQYKVIESVDELYRHFEQKSVEQFTVNPTIENEFTAKDGTIIRIPADAYTFEDGTPLDGQLIDLKVDEAVKPSAMLFYRLNTAKGNQALSTGGMVRIDVSANGRKLKMKEGKSVDVFVPSQEANPNMNLYRGERDAEQTMDWTQLEAGIDILNEDQVKVPKTRLQKTNVSGNVFKELAKIELDIPEKPVEFRELGLPPLANLFYPEMEVLKEPYKPSRVPKKKKVYVPKSIFKRLFFNKAKKQKELDDSYEARMTKYEVKQEKYEEDLKAYNESIQKYEEEVKRFEERFKADSIATYDIRVATIQPYYDECVAYEAALRLKNRFNTLAEKGSPELLEAYLFPQARNPLSDKSPLVFNHSSPQVMALCCGYCTCISPLYARDVERATIELFQNLSEYDRIVKLKDELIQKVETDRLIAKSKNNATIARIGESIQYYGFKVTSAEVFWCNIDTPLPEGRQLAIFSTPLNDKKSFEIFAFRPSKKSVHYIPKDMRKQIVFDEDDKVNYVAFDFEAKKPVLADGSFVMSNMQNVPLNFRPANIAEIERAILKVDQ